MRKASLYVLRLAVRLALYTSVYALFQGLMSKPAFPPLSALLSKGIPRAFAEYPYHLFPTLIRWSGVFLLGAIPATFCGGLLGAFPKVHAVLATDIDLFRSVPATAMVMFVMAAFGDNVATRCFPAWYITFFTVLFYVSKHAVAFSRDKVMHLKHLGASQAFIFANCILPELIQVISVALRQAVSLSFLVLVSVEIIVGPSDNRGVGRIMNDWMNNTAYSQIIITLGVLGVCGYLMNVGFELLRRKLVPWLPDQE